MDYLRSDWRVSMKSIFHIIILLGLSLTMISCSAETSVGYIIEVYDGSILLAKSISLEKYDEIKNMSANEIISESSLSLISLTYEDAKNFNKGDKVRVWIDGPIAESYPEQAKATKIEISE
jgi:Protein of unknown function (DUF3221)